MALRAKCVASKSKFGCLALIEILERHVYAMYEVLSLAGSLLAIAAAAASTKESAAAEQLTEKVLGIQVSLTPPSMSSKALPADPSHPFRPARKDQLHLEHHIYYAFESRKESRIYKMRQQKSVHVI